MRAEISEETIELRNSIKWKQPISWLFIRLFATLSLCALLISVTLLSKQFSSALITALIDNQRDPTAIERFLNSIETYELIFQILDMLMYLTISLNCVYIFSKIYRSSDHPKKFFITYVILAVAMYLGVVLLMRFVVATGIYTTLHGIFHNPLSGLDASDLIIADSMSQNIAITAGELVFNNLGVYNIFIDNVVMGMFYVFLMNNGKTEKRTKILRTCTIIPIVYVLVSAVINILSNAKVIAISPYVTPLLVGKKFFVYIFFFTLVTLLKIYTLKHNGEKPSSFWISSVITVLFLIISCIEIIFFVLSNVDIFPSASKYGLGNNSFMFLGIPFAFFYDYNKRKDAGKTILIPIAFLLIAVAVATPLAILTVMDDLQLVSPIAGDLFRLLKLLLSFGGE